MHPFPRVRRVVGAPSAQPYPAGPQPVHVFVVAQGPPGVHGTSRLVGPGGSRGRRGHGRDADLPPARGLGLRLAVFGHRVLRGVPAVGEEEPRREPEARGPDRGEGQRRRIPRGRPRRRRRRRRCGHLRLHDVQPSLLRRGRGEDAAQAGSRRQGQRAAVPGGRARLRVVAGGRFDRPRPQGDVVHHDGGQEEDPWRSRLQASWRGPRQGVQDHHLRVRQDDQVGAGVDPVKR